MIENTENEYPAVRKLTRKDRIKLSELISAFAEKSGNNKLTEMIPGVKKQKVEKEVEQEETEEESDKIFDLAKSVLQGMFEWIEVDVTKWFMDITGVTDQEVYDNLPFDIEVYIIDNLIKQKGFNNFFVRASGAFKKIRGLIK